MKVKHLLFGSIFLSMGFAACTNEVEEFAPQAPEKEFAGVELDDVTINLTNSDFSADAETRALLNKVETKWIAEWEENDAVGAAWFSKVKFGEDGKVAGVPVNIYKAFGSEYGSNAKFNWKGGVEFKADAVVMAGGYVLYHPYNETITDDMSEIPVQPIVSPQRFNCAPDSIANQVSENITAANVVKFLEGGDQLTDFTIKQIPNLYGLSFRIEDENLLKLESKLQISRIYVEVTKSGAPAINTTGCIKPSTFDITADTYNDVEGTSLPTIDFEGDAATQISRMQINVINEAKDAGYQITALDNPTSRFYFSMLPVEPGFDKVTIKIVGKMGKATKIFSRSYDASYSAWETLYAAMTGKGETIILPVKLNVVESVDNGIYDEEQFVEAWKAGQRVFNLAAELDLTTITDKKVNFTDAENNGHVIFSGEKVTLPTINGMYTFLNQVNIKGDATIVRCEEWDEESGITKNQHNAFTNADATIEGNLIVEGEAGVNINGKTTVAGNLTTKCNLVINEKLTVNKDLINETGKITVDSHAQVEGNLTVNGEFVGEKGKATIGGNLAIAEGAKVNLSYIKVTGTVEANGEFKVVKGDKSANAIIAGKLTANAPVVIDNVEIQDVDAYAAVTINGTVKKMGNVAANANVTIVGEVTEMGNLTTANSAAVSFGAAVNKIGNITAVEGTTVNFNGAVNAAAINTYVELIFPAAATATDITINKGTVTAKNTLNAKKITVNDKHAVLIANTKNLTVKEKLTANGLVDAISSEIGELEIADGITVNLKGTNKAKCVIGNLNVNKDMTYSGTLNGDYIAVKGGTNNGTITVPNFTISEGVFTQNGTFTGAITVAENATLDVDANTNADVTNNGTVIVAKDKSIIGAVVNNKNIELNGTLNEENGAITLAEGSVVKMAGSSKLNLTDNEAEDGEINVCNNAVITCKSTKTTYHTSKIVSYDWSETAPAGDIKLYINKYNINAAKLSSKSVFNAGAAIYASGTITFTSDMTFTNDITFEDNTIFTASKKAYNVKLTNNNNVAEGKTLEVQMINLAGGTIKLGTNANFVGAKGSATVTY